MIKLLKIVIFCVCIPQLQAQNYIPNYSFEDTVPVKVTPLYLPDQWTAATREGWNYLTPFNSNFPNWTAPSNAFGFQNARTGSSFVGIMIYHLDKKIRNPRREYMQAQLKQALVKDSSYCFEIHLSHADSSNFASRGQLGVYFSNTAVYYNTFQNLPYAPQIIVSPTQYVSDKINWVKYSHSYIAQGGEQYITIGNFNDTTSLDTIFVGGGNINNINYRNTYYYIDDVWLSHCDSVPDSLTSLEQLPLSMSLEVYPNPFKNSIIVQSQTTSQLSFTLYNSIGQSVSALRLSSALQQPNGKKYELDIGNIPTGLYWLRVSDGVREETIKLIKN